MDFEEFVLAASSSRLGDVEYASDAADALELRLDLAETGVEGLEKPRALPVLVTNRLDEEGGEAPATQARLDTLCRAVEQPAVEAVDIELSAVESGDGSRVIDHARAHDVAVVVSTHYFEATPDRRQMRETLSRASELGDVAKLAVTAATPSDVLDLLTVTQQATADGDTVATMAMGEPGRHSRVVAPLYGSRIGYAPPDRDRATAPGQYDLDTFRQLYESLRDGGPSS
jgi:3-dehydroquinate dehydratase-1